jgi:ubiquinone/menaquinone biosynthesis C-methylase UbiE
MPESVNFDRMADRYDESRGGEARGRYVAGELAAYLPPGRLLEIGVGTGLIARAFADLGWQVVGIDLSDRMLRHAARRLPGRVARADAAKLPAADGSVDACLAVHVMHLVGDAKAVVGEVARVLRPGGRFAVVRGGQNVDSGDITAAMAIMQERLPEHRERLAQADLVRDLARAAGLRLVEDFEFVRELAATTPRQAIAAIEDRLSSRLWDLSDETWARAVEPTLADLRALPDQDRPRATVVGAPTLVFEAPGPA